MKIVLTGGGTAGHAYPAINVATYLKTHYQADLYYIGNHHFIEASIAMDHHIPFYSIPSKGLEGDNPFMKYSEFGFNNLRGVLKALSLLKEIKPDMVFATGGFVSAPVLAACQILHIPYSIHEQNSVIGKVNRLFKNKSAHIFRSFPVTEEGNGIYSGNPVRFKEKLEKNGEKAVFVGGSGGSVHLNEAAILFAEKNKDIPCMLLTGNALYETYQAQVKEKNISNMEIIAYASDMLEVYKQAKIIIARSGAGTIFEIANLSIPSIFIPLPTSADDHQKKNALFFEQQGAAVLIEQGNGFHESLEETILDLWSHEEKREELKKNIDKLAVRESDKVIADALTKNFREKSLHGK